MSKELISVIIPFYNQHETILFTIQSVLNQTYSNFEIIIVENGSDLDIQTIVENFKDDRVFYLKQKHQNANVARNLGINKSNGKYIAMLDADDLWLENHLSECLTLLKEENADGLYGSLILKNENLEKVVYSRELNDDELIINYILSYSYGAQTSTYFMTSNSIKNIMWDEELHRHQDYDFIVRYHKKYKLIAKKNPTVIYRLPSHQKNFIDFESCIKFIKQYEHDIDPKVYNFYHKNMLNFAIKSGADELTIKHYKRESTFYKEFISFAEYLSIRSPKTKMQIIKYKWEYLLYIYRLKIEL